MKIKERLKDICYLLLRYKLFGNEINRAYVWNIITNIKSEKLGNKNNLYFAYPPRKKLVRN